MQRQKRVFQKGFEGLMDHPPIPIGLPHETPAEIERKVISPFLENPGRRLSPIRLW